jgi:hypothetical protein
MKKGSTTASKQSRNFSQRQLTVGLDLVGSLELLLRSG